LHPGPRGDSRGQRGRLSLAPACQPLADRRDRRRQRGQRGKGREAPEGDFGRCGRSLVQRSSMERTDLNKTDFAAMSRLSADIDLTAEGKATGFVRVPHSVHRSAYGWIPIPIVRLKNGEGPSVLMQAGNHGDEWEGQIGLGNLIRALQPK